MGPPRAPAARRQPQPGGRWATTPSAMAMIHQVGTPPGRTHAGKTAAPAGAARWRCLRRICRFAPLKLIPDNDGELLSLPPLPLRRGGGWGGRRKGREGGREGGRWKWIVHCHVPPINGQRDSRIRQGRRRKREGGKREQGREDGFSATPVRHLFGPDGKDTDDSEIKAIPGGRRSRYLRTGESCTHVRSAVDGAGKENGELRTGTSIASEM